MADNVFIHAKSRKVFAVGGGPASLTFTIGSTFDLEVGFLDDFSNVIALPEGSPGRLIIKPLERFNSLVRVLMPAWTVTGEGPQRRYHFRSVLDSGPLRKDLANIKTKAYEIQIEYVDSGSPYIADPIPLTVINSYFQGSDTAPEMPFGGPESIEFHAEVFPPGTLISNGTHYAANANRGGDIFNLRLSVDDYQPGSTVQLLVNGVTNVFTTPVAITAQSAVWTPDDVDNKLAITTIPEGARIDAITTFTPTTEYPVAPSGLIVDIAIRTRTTIEAQGWEWIKTRLEAGENITLTYNEENQRITIAATAESSGTVIWGEIEGTLADQEDLAAAIAARAPLASPALTGAPTAPTAADGTNSTQLATTAFVQAALALLVDSSPGTLNTLNELAAAIGDDPNFAATLATSIGLKAPLASPALSGTPTAPTAAGGTNTTQIATTAFVLAAIAGFVSTTRSVSTAGLATGGGTLGADRTITVPAASQAEAEAGTDNTKAMTPQRTAQAIAALSAGGAHLIRVSGQLNGNTSPYVPATTAFAHINVDFWSNTNWGVLTISVNGGSTIEITISDTNPGGAFWVDATSLSSGVDLKAALTALSLPLGMFYTDDGGHFGLLGSGAGAAYSVEAVSAVDNVMILSPGVTAGTDEIAASGAINSVVLIAGVAGKRVRLVSAWVDGALDSTVMLLTTGGTPCAIEQSPNGDCATFYPTGSTLDTWNNGVSGEGLKAITTGSPGDITGLSSKVWVVAEQY